MTRLQQLCAVMGLIVSAACYSPDLRDCTVRCDGPDDCAVDHVCGADGFCAAPDVAGSCGLGVAPDAAAASIVLRVKVDGTGKVMVVGIGECTHDCEWQVPARPLQFDAIETDEEKQFERWTTTNCGSGSSSRSCTVMPVGETMVGAKFE